MTRGKRIVASYALNFCCGKPSWISTLNRPANSIHAVTDSNMCKLVHTQVVKPVHVLQAKTLPLRDPLSGSSKPLFHKQRSIHPYIDTHFPFFFCLGWSALIKPCWASRFRAALLMWVNLAGPSWTPPNQRDTTTKTLWASVIWSKCSSLAPAADSPSSSQSCKSSCLGSETRNAGGVTLLLQPFKI